MKGRKGFVKGDPNINRNGRPEGAKDKRWYDLNWWYSLIIDNVDKLNEVQKVELGLKGLALIVSKLPQVPATPQESVDRVVDVHGELNKAELNDNPKPSNDAVRLGTGETEI